MKFFPHVLPLDTHFNQAVEALLRTYRHGGIWTEPCLCWVDPVQLSKLILLDISCANSFEQLACDFTSPLDLHPGQLVLILWCAYGLRSRLIHEREFCAAKPWRCLVLTRDAILKFAITTCIYRGDHGFEEVWISLRLLIHDFIRLVHHVGVSLVLHNTGSHAVSTLPDGMTLWDLYNLNFLVDLLPWII